MSPCVPVVAHGVLGLDRVRRRGTRGGRRSRTGSSSLMCDVKPGFTNSDRAPGLRVGAHDRVLDGLERRNTLALPAALADQVEHALELGLPVVHGGERADRKSCSAGLSASNAACWSEKRVSPPAAGTTTARRIDPSGGRFTNVTSVCQRDAPGPGARRRRSWRRARRRPCSRSRRPRGGSSRPGMTGWPSVGSPNGGRRRGARRRRGAGRGRTRPCGRARRGGWRRRWRRRGRAGRGRGSRRRSCRTGG